MRRSFALVAVIGLTAFGGMALAAIRQDASQKVVCPLAGGSGEISCCGPPTIPPIPCCPLGVICAGQITIGSIPNPSTAGHRVTISGKLEIGASGNLVLLWQRLPNGTLKEVAQTTTATSGEYEFVRDGVETNRQWYVNVSGTGVTSSAVEQEVRAVVMLTPQLHLRVTPNHAGERALIERLTNRGWNVIARVKLPRSSAGVDLSLPVRSGETSEVRAVLPADTRNIRSVSNVIRLRR
jgi:hypothetical protein